MEERERRNSERNEKPSVDTRVSLKETGYGSRDSAGNVVYTQEESLYRWRNKGVPRHLRS